MKTQRQVSKWVFRCGRAMGKHMDERRDLPGNDLVAEGVRDLRAGRETVAGLLVAIGAPRLRALGIAVPDVPSPEHRLYDLLARTEPDSAHGRYNALIRRLCSFERALECEHERAARG
jgi:hypothetical protein